MKNELFIMSAFCLLFYIGCEKEASVLESADLLQNAIKVLGTNWDAVEFEHNDSIQHAMEVNDFTPITYPQCDCFSMEELQELKSLQPWPYGWFSDVPGSCKEAPYGQLMEVWLTNIGQPARNDDFSAQAGTINGIPFASKAKFNHHTGQFEVLCGGYTTAQNAKNCALILHDFIHQMRCSDPNWDYCVRFP